MILKKIFAAAMLALPFALLYLLMSVAYTPSGEGYDDLKDFVASSGVDMRGKIEAPPDFDIQEPVAFGGGRLQGRGGLFQAAIEGPVMGCPAVP